MNSTHNRSSDARQDWPSTGHAWTVTSLLLLAYVLSFIDRQILNLLVEPIKADLGLSDLQISYLQGPAFVATYILISFPLGRLSDSVNRTRLLAAGLGFWTLATMACGLSRSGLQLGAARAAVGIGEATLTPTAWSLLADSFPPHKRTIPFSIYLTGPYLGAGLAMMFGAEILGIFPGAVSFAGIELQPWQLCFLLVSSPGLILAALMALSKEPARILSEDEDPERRGFSDFLRFIRRQWRVYAGIWLGSGLLAVMLYGLQAWTPAFLIRVHGMGISEAGFQYGVIALIAGSLGVLSGPHLHKALLKSTGQDHALSIGVACPAVLAVLGLLLSIADGGFVLALIALLSFVVTIPLALMAAALQLITPNYFRGRVAAVFVVSTNILGLGFGPTFVAFMTDEVFADALRIGSSMAALFLVFGLASAGFYLLGRRSFMRQAG